MEPQIGSFADDLLTIAVFRRHNRLGGLFTDLLEYRVQTLVVQLRDVGAVGLGLLALLQHLCELVQCIVHAAPRDVSARYRARISGARRPATAAWLLRSGQADIRS